MIIAEQIIKAIIAEMPEIEINSSYSNKIQFGEGSKEELTRWLLMMKDNAYPLVWLLPSPDDYEKFETELHKTCKFVIATRETNKDLFNFTRYNKAFDIVLKPTLDYLLKGLQKSSISRVNGQEWTIEKFPNYSESSENSPIDLWDALTLEIDVIFDNDIKCLKSINYNV